MAKRPTAMRVFNTMRQVMAGPPKEDEEEPKPNSCPDLDKVDWDAVEEERLP